MDWRPIVNRCRLFPAAPTCLSLIFPASGGSTGWRWKLVDALWEWGFNFQAHWGEHASSAIRALHCYLAQEDPSGLCSDC